MQQATHLYSKMTGTIIGAHLGMKAQLVRLSSGEKQYWKNDSIIMEEKDMTDKILIRLSGPQKKTWQIIERYFDTVDQAAEYLQEMKGLNDIDDFSKSGECAGMSNGWNISANYDIRQILKRKPPTKDLHDIYPFDLNRAMGRVSPIRISSGSKELSSTGDAPTLKNKSFKSSGKTVKLQDLTNDPRKARVVLRELVRKKKITKPGRWEWDAGSPDIEIVKAALNKK